MQDLGPEPAPPVFGQRADAGDHHQVAFDRAAPARDEDAGFGDLGETPPRPRAQDLRGHFRHAATDLFQQVLARPVHDAGRTVVAVPAQLLREHRRAGFVRPAARGQFLVEALRDRRDGDERALAALGVPALDRRDGRVEAEIGFGERQHRVGSARVPVGVA
nr:hypothetical protein [Glycomyces buryatensis]